MNRSIYTMLLVGTLAVGALAQSSKQAETSLIGIWKSDEATVELKAKNVAIFNGQQVEWAANDKTIALANDEGSMSFPYVLKGDVLTVWVEERKVVYKRISAEEARRSGPSAQTNRTSGSIQQELVGKWCYSANVNAIGGGRQSDICFTLKADGTYEYYGEASNSNPYGGSNSQSWDYGRWSATATTLTANSNSGKTTTYSLEKRNHPKTGDPMLIVDGDAFVTFYQRRPW
ncbi:MAG TPA: hypothetical protein PKA82_03000 [Pyrinomonadaceae bacterium]|nr:hypothetical protein [Pyrinomonadaceae bacterium]